MSPQTATPKPAQPFNPNQTPKQRFQTIPAWIGAHRQMVDSEAFTRACDMALLQYQRKVTSTITDGAGAGSAGLRLQGAQEFLSELRNLSESPPTSPTRPDDNLRHS